MQLSASSAVLSLLVGAASLTTAQSNYQPGYVLSLSGDTVRGTIDFHQWTRNPSRVDFRSAAGEAKNYGPTEIRGFAVANERYEGAVVQVDGSPFSLSELPKSSALQMRRDETFVRVLFSGPKSLYIYQDRNDKEHFFIRQNGGLELLLYKQFIQDEGSNRVITDRSYVDQLQTYLADCPTIGRRVRTAPYTSPGLQKVFNEYYTCTNAGQAFRQSSESQHLKIGVLAGVGLTKVNVRFDNSPSFGVDQLENARYNASTKPAGGLFGEFALPRRLKRLSIVPELFYTGYESHYSYSSFTSADNYTNGEVNLKFDYARVNALLRYNYPVGANAGLFANAGISWGYAFNAENTRRETVRFYSQETTRTTPAYGGLDRNEQTAILGLGGRVWRLSGEGRFELGNGFTNVLNQKSSTQRFYFLLGFRL